MFSEQARQLGVEESKVEFAPTVRPEFAAARRDSGTEAGAGAVASKKTTFGTELEAGGVASRDTFDEADPLYRNSLRVGLTQPLLRQFGRLVNTESITQAKSSLDAARREIELRRTDLVVEVVESYEDLLRLQRQLESDEQTFARLDKLQRLTRTRERQGRATRVDVLRVDLQFSEAQSRVSRTRERLESQRADFADLLGYPVDRVFVAQTNPVLKIDVGDPVAATDIALQNRLDYAPGSS